MYASSGHLYEGTPHAHRRDYDLRRLLHRLKLYCALSRACGCRLSLISRNPAKPTGPTCDVSLDRAVVLLGRAPAQQCCSARAQVHVALGGLLTIQHLVPSANACGCPTRLQKSPTNAAHLPAQRDNLLTLQPDCINADLAWIQTAHSITMLAHSAAAARGLSCCSLQCSALTGLGSHLQNTAQTETLALPRAFSASRLSIAAVSAVSWPPTGCLIQNTAPLPAAVRAPCTAPSAAAPLHSKNHDEDTTATV